MNKGSRHAIPFCYRSTTIILPTPRYLHNTIKTVLPCHIDMGVQFFNEYMYRSNTVTAKEVMKFSGVTSPEVDRR